ncbi:LacI family DNA-binding transcriptional regulator [Lacinutrix chionoecetis]
MSASITLKDLSSLSGFSVSTVSKALNNKVDISIETRKTIRTIAEEHNYIPNNFAVALRKKSSKVIAIILPQVNQSFFGCFLFNIQKKASALGYRMLFFQSFNEHSKEIEYINSINDGSVAGAIVLSVNKFSKHNTNFPVEIVALNDFTDKNESKSKLHCLKKFNTLLEKV